MGFSESESSSKLHNNFFLLKELSQLPNIRKGNFIDKDFVCTFCGLCMLLAVFQTFTIALMTNVPSSGSIDLSIVGLGLIEHHYSSITEDKLYH